MNIFLLVSAFAATLLMGCHQSVDPKTEAAPSVYTQGQVTIRGTFSCDLDQGREASLAQGDFFWEQTTATERYIAPDNGATFSVTNRQNLSDMTYGTLVGLSYSNTKINASATSANRIPAGTIVAYQTSEGRYGAFQVVTYGYNLSIRWLTYNKS